MATSSQYSVSVGTTNVWDPSQVLAANLEPALQDILVRMYQNLNLMALVLNSKDTGMYNNSYPIVNSQQWFPNPVLSSATPTSPTNRPVNRLVLRNTAGPVGAGVTNLPHGLTPNATWSFTRIYGTASDIIGFNYYPLPFASAAGATNIELRVDATNAIITNNSGVTFDVVYVILEYITS